MSNSQSNLQDAHRHSSKHRAQVEKSDQCGCFYCLKTFSPSEIHEWWDDEQTAVCPHCGVDSVLGSGSGYPLTADFLAEMHKHYFQDMS